MNNLIQRGLRSAEYQHPDFVCPDFMRLDFDMEPLEPPGCSRPDGKKPDGLSLIPWANGKLLLWDFTCSDTFASSYVDSTSKHVGSAAKTAEMKKINQPLFRAVESIRFRTGRCIISGVF